jgi:predicted site-specific integrase-resolvase
MEYITLKEAREISGLSYEDIKDLAKKKLIKSAKVKGTVYYDREDIKNAKYFPIFYVCRISEDENKVKSAINNKTNVHAIFDEIHGNDVFLRRGFQKLLRGIGNDCYTVIYLATKDAIGPSFDLFVFYCSIHKVSVEVINDEENKDSTDIICDERNKDIII